eukprot:TRINITY_DN814_c0_g1_i1.p1 TRINITY_DN814_c0_g1~~TRINITY_DN814_c0_g1_i1.p1  ORF type:complete len:785 (+),score=94.43 TRINITY_DN814_c0_g1_i1:97-2451(+)
MANCFATAPFHEPEIVLRHLASDCERGRPDALDITAESAQASSSKHLRNIAEVELWKTVLCELLRKHEDTICAHLDNIAARQTAAIASLADRQDAACAHIIENFSRGLGDPCTCRLSDFCCGEACPSLQVPYTPPNCGTKDLSRSGSSAASSSTQPAPSVSRSRTHEKQFAMRSSSCLKWTTHTEPELSPSAPSLLKLCDHTFSDFVKSSTFDMMSGLSIMLFAVLLGAETDYMSRSDGLSHTNFMIAHVVFNMCFIAELVIRIFVYRLQFVCGEDRIWNIVDFFMVLSGLADIWVWVSSPGNSSGDGQEKDSSSGMVRAVKGVRMLRLVKTCRIARMLRYVHEFKKMVFSLQASLMTLLWCVTLIFALLYMFSIVFTQGATDYLVTMSDSSESESMKQFYGNLPRTILTLYAAMSNGISWELVLRPLVNIGWIYAALFITYITFAIFGLLNVLTSVFVESTMKSAHHYKELVVQETRAKKEVATQHLRSLFQQMDENGDGEISMTEMKFHLDNSSDCIRYLEACDISINDVGVLFRLIDRDDSGTINISEFCEGCLKLKGEAKSFDIHCMIYENLRFLSKWAAVNEEFQANFDNLEARIQEQINLLSRQDRMLGILTASVQRSLRFQDERMCPVACKTNGVFDLNTSWEHSDQHKSCHDALVALSSKKLTEHYQADIPQQEKVGVHDLSLAHQDSLTSDPPRRDAHPKACHDALVALSSKKLTELSKADTSQGAKIGVHDLSLAHQASLTSDPPRRDAHPKPRNPVVLPPPPVQFSPRPPPLE